MKCGHRRLPTSYAAEDLTWSPWLSGQTFAPALMRRCSSPPNKRGGPLSQRTSGTFDAWLPSCNGRVAAITVWSLLRTARTPGAGRVLWVAWCKRSLACSVRSLTRRIGNTGCSSVATTSGLNLQQPLELQTMGLEATLLVPAPGGSISRFPSRRRTCAPYRQRMRTDKQMTLCQLSTGSDVWRLAAARILGVVGMPRIVLGFNRFPILAVDRPRPAFLELLVGGKPRRIRRLFPKGVHA